MPNIPWVSRYFHWANDNPKDYKKAMRYLTKASEQGHGHATIILANMYLNGYGVKPDAFAAFRLLHAAAWKGSPNAQAILGTYYCEGIGVEKNISQCCAWFDMAAAQEIEEAKKALTETVQKMTPRQIEKATAISKYLWIQIVAANPHDLFHTTSHHGGTVTLKETAPHSQELVHRLGGIEGIRSLANCFYDTMDEASEAQKIRAMHPANLDQTRENLALFLSGWLGGPSLYVKKYGSVNLTDIHLHLKINSEERDMWLFCMEQALDKLEIATDLKTYLLKRFRIPAEKIRLACQEQLQAGLPKHI